MRYADDFVILCKSPEKAQQALEVTGDILEGLKLGFNKHKTSIVDFNHGFRFLGVQFIRSLAFKSQQAPAEKIVSSDKQQKPAKKAPDKNNPKTKHEQPKRWFSYALSAESEYTSTDEMREAFNQAGIAARQFPSEAEPEIDHFEPPEFADADAETDLPENNEPRLKTLYLMEHGSTLGKEYERFVIKRKGKVIKQIPAIHVDQVMVFGNSQLTTQVMQYCLQQRIPIYLLSGKGRFYGMVDSFSTEPVLLHREQFLRAAEKDFCLQLAKQFINGKIANSRLLLKRQTRHRDAEIFKKASQQFEPILTQLKEVESLGACPRIESLLRKS